MLEYFEKNWWLWLLRGLVALLFAGMAWTLTNPTWMMLVLLVSAFIFSDGLFALLSLFARRTEERWSWTVVFEGLTGFLASVALCLLPGQNQAVLLTGVSLWALVAGALKLTVAVRCRKASCVPGTWILGFTSLATLAFGLFLLTHPLLDSRDLLRALSFYALLSGLMMVMEGLRLRQFYRTFDVKKVHLQLQQPYYPA